MLTRPDCVGPEALAKDTAFGCTITSLALDVRGARRDA